jgi:hypothetical protein
MRIQSTVIGRMVVLAAVTLALSGCKASPTIEVYLSDIVAVANGESKPVTASARVSAEVLSKTKCEEEQAKLVAILQKVVDGLKDFTCADGGQLSFLGEARFTTPVPIVAFNDKGEAQLANLLVLAVLKEPDFLRIDLFLDAKRMKALAADVRSQYFYDLGKGEIGTVTVTVVNDLPADREIMGSVSYVNGAPRAFRWKQTLAHRDKIEIGLSNVHSDGLRTGTNVPVFSLMSKP